MVTKFYLHDAATTNTGTLPGAGVTAILFSPTITQIIDGSNRSADGSIGAAQTSKVATTNATTASQTVLFARFLSAPIAAQTIAAQTVTYSLAAAESSTNSNMAPNIGVAVWRPGTGARVANVASLSTPMTEPGTTQTALTSTRTSSSATAQDGDVLVFELWRNSSTQSMATAYTNTIYFDGTTEGSATSNAAYVLFTNNIAMSSGAVPSSAGFLSLI